MSEIKPQEYLVQAQIVVEDNCILHQSLLLKATSEEEAIASFKLMRKPERRWYDAEGYYFSLPTVLTQDSTFIATKVTYSDADPHVSIEYDEQHFGGNYSDVGEFLYVAVPLFEYFSSAAEALEAILYLDPCHLINSLECEEDYVDSEGNPINHL